MKKTTEALIKALHIKIKNEKPLIHHITNYVTVNDCANSVLALGASPIMADDLREIEEISAISSALVLNIGTLNTRTIESMLQAGKTANQKNIPIILDPVGAGASTFRNDTTLRLIEELKISVIRGNMSEIGFIHSQNTHTKGVDVSEEDKNLGIDAGMALAQALAKKLDTIIGITGVTDIVSNGQDTLLIKNGHPMLSLVTGTGCMTSSLVGSFCSVTTDYFTATAAGILSMCLAGEKAYTLAGKKGTSSFRTALIDSISQLDEGAFSKMDILLNDFK